MDIVSLSSAPVTGLNSSSSRKGLFERRSFPSEQSLTFPYRRWCPDVPQLNYRDFRARAPGVVRSTTKSNQETTDEMKQETQVKDDNLAFVAGATGKVGSRTVRELLKLGFKVRAGVRSPQKAESLVQSVRQMKLDDGSTGIQYVEKLEIVECDLENRSNIGPAVGNASMVLCCIGASEKEIFDITGPYRIDYQATKNLIDAATVAKVDHFILLTSLGTNKIGFPAAILNLFWGVLIWKRKAEESLIASGLPYTIVRPGGMERPTDAYKETHNIVLAEGDTLFGGQVSNLQVAELMAFMAKNRILSYCKVVEVIAETSAALTPLGELLVKIPSQRPESRPREPETAPSKSASEPVKFDSEKEPTQTKAQKTRPLSPYVAYDDLKPPTSPTPTQPGNPKGHIGVIQPVSESDTPKIKIGIPGLAEGVIETKSAAQVEVQKASPLSPYVAYDDLKPPTSPSPDAPTASLFSSSTQINNSITEPLKAGKPGYNQPFEVPKSRPLSPFTMYEDVKPPASPIPPLRKW